MAAFMSRISFSRKPNSKVYNHNPAGSGSFHKNPCDPDLKLKAKRRSLKTPYAPSINHLQHKTPLSNGSAYSDLSFRRNIHNNSCYGSGDFENQSSMKLDACAVHKAEETTQTINGCLNKAEETTQTINGCLKVAEEMRESASKVIVNLHQQGEQIMRTHQSAVRIDHNLRRGEKLLGSLGGLFSKKWKPKKTSEINGPVFSLFTTKDDSFSRGYHIEQRQKLGLTPPRLQWNPRRFFSEPPSVSEKVELEKAKQDDALLELSNLVGKLKAMAVDMGSEIDRQNKSLDQVQDDVDGLNIRIKDANLRFRRLLRR